MARKSNNLTMKNSNTFNRYGFVFLLMLATFFTSCSKDDGHSTEGIEEIAGKWTANSATFNGVNVIEEGGEVTFVISEKGRFTFTIKRASGRTMSFSGNLWFDEEWLAVEYDTDQGEVEYYDISYDATNLHLGANSEFDFDGNGTDEIVIFFLEMIRV